MRPFDRKHGCGNQWQDAILLKIPHQVQDLNEYYKPVRQMPMDAGVIGGPSFSLNTVVRL